MRVRWTKPALTDLESIENYISMDNPERAFSFIMELIDLGDSLAQPGMAERGTPAKWADDRNIRELYYGNYTIIYEISEKEAIIHEVHNSARIKRHFRP